MKSINKNKCFIIIILVIVFLTSSLIIFFKKQCEYTRNRYDLEEINSGIYAIYYQTISSIPSYNYEVVEICISGNIYTYKGEVFISYTNDDPYVVTMKNNIVNDDKVYLHVPKGTVEHLHNVVIR